MTGPFKIAGKPSNDVTGQVGDDVPEVPASIPRHLRDGRPKIRNPHDTAKFSYYSRASGFGKVIESTYNLDRWNMRMVAFGMSRRNDLVMAAQAVAACEDRTDEVKHQAHRNDLQRIADDAKDYAGASRAAAEGTALHKLSEQVDAGEDVKFVDPRTWAALQAWRRLTAGFRVVAAETFVVCDDLSAGGSFDRLWAPLASIVAPDGAVITPDDRIIGDLKSTRTSKYFGPGYSVQQWIYASGTPYVHVPDADAAPRKDGTFGDNGRRGWPDGIAPRRDWALIPHIPIDHPDDAGLMWVNLARGEQLAELAQAVRAARRFDDLFCEAPVSVGRAAPYDPLARADALDLVLVAVQTADCEAAIDALYDAAAAAGGPGWTDAHTAAARIRMAELVPA